MRKLTIAAGSAGAATLAGVVAIGVKRRQHLSDLDTQLIETLRQLDPEPLNDSTALAQIATDHNLNELAGGADFRQTITSAAARKLLVGAFLEIRTKQAAEPLTLFEQDYLVYGLPGAIREGRKRRQRDNTTVTPEVQTEVDASIGQADK